MKNAPAKEVAVIEPQRPGVLAASPDTFGFALTLNLGANKLTAQDLTRIKVPSGGATEWISETFEGERREKNITGIIALVRDVRSYWKAAYGTGEAGPPDCQSPDAVTGYGDPGGLCARCPKNVFGSKSQGRGKACSEMKQLFIYRGQSMLPELVQLPPTSLRECRRYLLHLATTEHVPYFGVQTELSLVPVTNSANMRYSQVRFRKVEKLTADETQRMAQVHKDLIGYVGDVGVTARYDGDDNL